MITATTQPIQQKLENQEQLLNTMSYNHDNLCHNMGEEFKARAE